MLIEIQNASGCSWCWWWRLTLGIKCCTEWRRNVDVWNFAKLPCRHQLDVVTFVSNSLINIKQRESEHPNRRQQDCAQWSKYAPSDCVPCRPVSRMQGIDSTELSEKTDRNRQNHQS